MNWHEAYERSLNDPYRQSDILRAVLVVSKSQREISDVVDRMEILPLGLQGHIAWDVVNNPQTTFDIYERVKWNLCLVSKTDIENIQSAWNRNH